MYIHYKQSLDLRKMAQFGRKMSTEAERTSVRGGHSRAAKGMLAFPWRAAREEAKAMHRSTGFSGEMCHFA